MSATVDLTRRTFLVASAGVGAGLVLGCRAETHVGGEASEVQDFKPNAFVHIGSDSTVTITVAKPDIGQGVRTSLAMIVAEELGVDWESVHVRQAGVEPGVGGQGVGGSGSIRGTYGPLREAGATAAMMLQQAADAKWGKGGPSAARIRIEKGMVIHSSGKSAKLGDLAVEAAKLPIPDGKPTLKDKSEFSIIGKPTRRVDNKDVVTGKAKFGLDHKHANKVVATIERANAFGGRAASFDDTETKKIPGVVKVMEVGGGVAVVASNTWAALKGREALKVTWDHGPNATLSSEELRGRFTASIKPFPDMPAGAAKTVEATYELPYLSHACMEPMNCTVHRKGDTAEIWVPTQSPEGMRGSAARVLGIPAESIKVNVTLAGGGFGRRGGGDFISECAAIAKEFDIPVQLLWTRADDMQHDAYRPLNFHALKGAVDASGELLAYYHQSFEAGGRGRGGAQEPSWAGLRAAYRIPNGGFMRGRIESPVPTGAWRSVENSYSIFVMESFFDELCAAGGKDPLRTRLALITDERVKRTLEMAGEKAEWGKTMPKGWGRGVACFNGYGSAITQIADVEIVNGEPFVRRVVAVVDCGVAINPMGIEAQIQGATVDAIATTLFAGNSIEKGGVPESTFHDFGWAKMEDAPRVEVHIIADGNTPGGMGEVGFPAAGAAVANAIFAATGKRLRNLPMRVHGL